MKRILKILEGAIIGLLGSGSIVLMGDVISGSAIGITLTLVLCTFVGGLLNRFSGLCAGLIAGGVAVILGNMVSQTTFGIGATLVGGVFIGGLLAWELSNTFRHVNANSGQFHDKM